MTLMLVIKMRNLYFI